MKFDIASFYSRNELISSGTGYRKSDYVKRMIKSADRLLVNLKSYGISLTQETEKSIGRSVSLDNSVNNKQ